ncbi:AraC family transcriptional regulator [Lachnospiraceae bacterium 48-42]
MEDAYVLQLSNRKFSELYLCCCGYSKCEPLHSFGPAVRPDYLIHFILKGKGRYYIGETQYCLEAGQGFLIEPNVLTFYQADAEDPWEYLWVGFNGSNVKEYLRDVGLNSGQLIFRSDYGAELKDTVVGMIRDTTGSITGQYERQGLLYTFFAILSKNVNISTPWEEDGENIHIKRAVEYVRNNYFNAVRVTDIAKYVCIDRTYLYELFRRHLDVSPQEYLTNYRLTRAAELLTLTDLTLGEIAMSCGYQNAYSFGKAFKAKRGITPAKYREKNRSERKEYLESHKDTLKKL